MEASRLGVSAMAGLLVVVLVIAAAFYVAIPMVASTSTTSTSAGSSTIASSSSGATGSGTLTISTKQPLIVSPHQNEVVTLSLTAIGSVSGNYTFSVSGLPSGVTASFQPSAVDLPAQLRNSVTMTLSAATGAAVVNSTMTVVATAGSSVFTSQLPVMSVPALVIIQGNAFHPSSLSVPVGTKVYWLNLDFQGGGDVALDYHDVTALDHSFSSGNGNLAQYSIYGHTFTTAGTVQYESLAQPTMTAQVAVG